MTRIVVMAEQVWNVIGNMIWNTIRRMGWVVVVSWASLAVVWADPPTYDSNPTNPTNITEDALYTDTVEVSDIKGHSPIEIALQSAPSGMTISSTVLVSCVKIDRREICKWRATISWTPTNNDTKTNYNPSTQSGAHDVTIRATDQKFSNFTDYSYKIYVKNVNDPPVITAIQTQNATEGALWTYQVLASDIDPTADTLVYSLKTAPTGMQIEKSTGKLTWTPVNTDVGTHSVTVRVEDGKGGITESSFTINVANTNDPPVIVSTPSTGATKNLLYTYQVNANDPDPTNDKLTYTLLQGPTGMVMDSASGLLKWTPQATDINKSFNVSIEVTDGKGGKDTQAWVIKVVGANDAPVITSNPVTGATEDTLYTYTVAGQDANTDPIVFSLEQAPQGMTIQRVDDKSATIRWTPTNSQVGSHAVKIQADDGRGGVVSQSYTVVVVNTNDPPKITSTPTTVVDEDAAYEYKVTAIDEDPTNDKLTFSLTTSPTGMVIDPTLGVIRWVPDNSFANQKVSVTVKVSDGQGGSDTQSFQIEVRNVNDPPVFTSTPPTTATENTLLNYQVTATDPDPTSDVLTYRLVSGPSGMKIDGASGMLSWTPTNDHAIQLNHIVTLEVTDGKGGKATQSFTIVVKNVNTSPSITSTPLTAAVVGQAYQYDVDATDPDPTNDTLTYSLVTQPSGMKIDSATGIISWTPQLSDQGTQSVEVKVTDNQGASDSQKFTIQVIDKNIPPAITSTPTLTATEDVLYSYEIKANDADQDKLTFVLEQAPSGVALDKVTGLLKWTPTNDDVGTQVIQLRVEDGRGGVARQRFSVVVANVNDNPVISSVPSQDATEKALYTYQVKASDPDPTQDVLSYALKKSPKGMSIDSKTGVVSWTPTNEDVGTHLVEIEVSDGKGGSAVQSYTLNVKNVNDPPKFTSQPITQATEDVLYQYRAQAQDIDLTQDKLTYTLVLGPKDLGMTLDPDTGLLQWTPTNAHVGSYKIEIMVSDGKGGTDNQTFTLIVVNVNDDPIISSVPPQGATQGQQYKYTVKASDPDPTNDVLTYSLKQTPLGGTNQMQINPNTGELTWTPEQVHVGNKHLVSIEVNDGKGGKATQSWLIEVFNSNDVPVFSEKPTSFTTVEKQPFQYQVKATDADKDILLFSLLQNPTGMQISPSTGLIQWTPGNEAADKNHVVTVQIDDQKGGTASHTFSVQVTNVNDPPTITSTPETAATENKLYTYDVDAVDIDPTKDTLTYSLTSAPKGMTINASTGLIQWTPSNQDVGVHPIQVNVADGKGGQDNQSFTLVVSNVNDPPTFTSQPVTEAIEDQPYLYLVKATDPDPTQDKLTFSLTVSPQGMKIEPTTGLIEWTPTNDDAEKQHAVTVKVEDGNGASATQSFFLNVKNVNDNPEITSQPVTEVVMDELYSYQVKATDIDPTKDKLSFVLVRGPKGATLDKDSGSLQWKPTSLDVGEHDVEIRVDDDKGGSSKPQLFKLTVKVHPDSPVANAGRAIFSNPKQIQLDGSASADPKGQTLKYEWVLLEGPDTTIPLQKNTDQKPTIILRKVGVYKFRLVVDSGTKKSPPAFTTVTINNIKPFAHAGFAFATVVGQEAVLDGSRSDDSNGEKDTLTYAWKTEVGESVSLTGADSAQPKFTPTKPGAYQFSLIVTDSGKLQSEPATVWVVVYDPTQKVYPPHAQIAAPVRVAVGQELTLDGKRSRGFSGTALTFTWIIEEGPEKTVLLSGDKDTASFKAQKVGNYLIRLVVKEGDLSSPPTHHWIQVVSSAEQEVPVAKTKTGYGVWETSVTLDGSQSTSPQGAEVTLRWSQVEGPAVDLEKSDTLTPSFFVLNDGTYRFRLVIQLKDGVESLPSDLVIRVNKNKDNKPPLSQPGTNLEGEKAAKAGEPTELDGSQSVDPEGKPLLYLWRQVSGIPVMLEKFDTAKPGFTAYAYGIMKLELVVSDGDTLSLPGIEITVVVNDSKNSVPIADAGPDQTVLAGIKVTLDGSKSRDADGDTLKYRWRMLEPVGQTVSLDSTEPTKPTFEVPSDTKINQFIFGLVVDDGKIASLEDFVVIKVEGVNEAPKAVIAKVNPVKVGTTVTLDGSQSSDPNPGDKLEFSWKQVQGPPVDIKDQDKAKASFVASAVGTVTIELSVTDKTLTTKATIQVVVEKVEEPKGACGCDSHPSTSTPFWLLFLLIFGCFGMMRGKHIRRTVHVRPNGR